MAKSNDTNNGFKEQIWEVACVLWGHIPAAEYKKVIARYELIEKLYLGILL